MIPYPPEFIDALLQRPDFHSFDEPDLHFEIVIPGERDLLELVLQRVYPAHQTLRMWRWNWLPRGDLVRLTGEWTLLDHVQESWNRGMGFRALGPEPSFARLDRQVRALLRGQRRGVGIVEE